MAFDSEFMVHIEATAVLCGNFRCFPEIAIDYCGGMLYNGKNFIKEA